jgi:hypothetical protein
MSGKKRHLKYLDVTRICNIAGRIHMNLGPYFVTLEYVAMSGIFIALVLIFLYMYYGKDEEEEITD